MHTPRPAPLPVGIIPAPVRVDWPRFAGADAVSEWALYLTFATLAGIEDIPE